MKALIILLAAAALLAACETAPSYRNGVIYDGVRTGGFGGFDIAKPLSEN